MIAITLKDGSPVCVLETSACGTPFIVTRFKYTNEWFVDGEIKERNFVELADAIMDFYRDMSLIESMRRINRLGESR